MKINILGQDYEIIHQKESENPKLEKHNGLCEHYSKEIVICDFEIDTMTYKNPEALKLKILRHEIIHAFLFESGLAGNSEWAENEEMVDFFALQFHKIYKAMQEAEAI